ncbi:MAG: phosphotransferase [Chloroflexi bacterium]|nr:phosphotransferase [Chloroflexota bacterium]
MKASELARGFSRHWGELHDANEFARLGGGELKDVYRIDADGGPYALRIYTPDVSPEDVASELELVAPFAERLPEVPAAIRTDRGELQAAEGGRVAVLTTFVEGEKPDRQNPQHRRAGAEMLARLHSVAASIETPAPRPGFPARGDLDWEQTRWWSWHDIERYLEEHDLDELGGTDAAGLHRRLIGEVVVLPDALDQLARRGLPTMPIHNDYWEGNLIERDGRIVGIVDWDECAVDWRAIEVVDAACSFGRGELGYEFDPAAAREFVELYVDCGGEILSEERQALLPLRLIRLVWETLYELGRACQGYSLDQPYLWGNLTSLDGVDQDVFG